MEAFVLMRRAIPLLAGMLVGCASTIDGTGGLDGGRDGGGDAATRRDAAADARDVP
jgi:hypothetical protein